MSKKPDSSRERWRVPLSRRKPWATVKVHENTAKPFYDGDEVKVTVQIRGQGEEIVKPALVVSIFPLLAVWEEVLREWVVVGLHGGAIQSWQNRIPTEFKEDFFTVAPDDNYDIDVTFTIKQGAISSFTCKNVRLVWMAAVREKTANNSKITLVSPFSSDAVFTKVSVYIPIIGNETRVQAERAPTNFVGSTYSPVQIEAQLRSDVYRQGDVVTCHIMLHHNDMHLKPMVKSVEAGIYQSVQAVHQGEAKLRPSTTLLGHDDWPVSEWPLLPTLDGKGQWTQRDLLLSFNPKETDVAKCAVTYVPYRESSGVLCPSLYSKIDEGNLVEVQYYLQLTFHIKGANYNTQMVLKLPFSVETPPEEFAVDEFDYTNPPPMNLERRLSLPISPPPPSYEELGVTEAPFVAPHRFSFDGTVVASTTTHLTVTKDTRPRRRSLTERLPVWIPLSPNMARRGSVGAPPRDFKPDSEPREIPAEIAKSPRPR